MRNVVFVIQKLKNKKMLEILVLLSLEVGSLRLYSDSWKVLCTPIPDFGKITSEWNFENYSHQPVTCLRRQSDHHLNRKVFAREKKKKKVKFSWFST
jgi:hypothetical protein